MIGAGAVLWVLAVLVRVACWVSISPRSYEAAARRVEARVRELVRERQRRPVR